MIGITKKTISIDQSVYHLVEIRRKEREREEEEKGSRGLTEREYKLMMVSMRDHPQQRRQPQRR
jgi:hypothetical protein